MENKFEIHGVHAELDQQLKRYITQKINKLARYVPPRAQPSLHIDIYLSLNKTHGDKQYECEAVVRLPKETIRVDEATLNMYAAVDIVEAKLRQALLRYKDTHDSAKRERHLQNRVRGKP